MGSGSLSEEQIQKLGLSQAMNSQRTKTVEDKEAMRKVE
jgi:hypothetical protein